MAKIEETPKITLDEIDITKFPKLNNLSYGNNEAFGSPKFTFYLPKELQLTLSEEEIKWQEYKPTMGNIDFDKVVSQESINKVGEMSPEIIESYLKIYRCDKEQFIYIYDQISSGEPKIENEWNEEIDSKINNFHTEFILNYFGLNKEDYRKMRETENKIEDFYKDLHQKIERNENTLRNLLREIKNAQSYGCSQDIYEGFKWLDNPENIKEMNRESEKRLNESLKHIPLRDRVQTRLIYK